MKARQIQAGFPFWESLVTLGRVIDRDVAFATTKGDKDAMLRTAIEDRALGAIFFCAWTGQWRTDLFAVTEEDLVEFIASR
jgi:hypothetical protein